MAEEKVTRKQKLFFFGAVLSMILIGTLIVQGEKWLNNRKARGMKAEAKVYMDSLRRVPQLRFICMDSVQNINLDSLIAAGFHVRAYVDFIDTLEGVEFSSYDGKPSVYKLEKTYRFSYNRSNFNTARLLNDQPVILHDVGGDWPREGKYKFFLEIDEEASEAFKEHNRYASRFVLARKDFRLTKFKCDSIQ